jgi:predicted alpha/beta-fold hydrolase
MTPPADDPTLADAFTAPWWLRGPHGQTVWGRLTRPRRLVTMRREILTTPDDDDLVLDHLVPLHGVRPGEPPHFVLLHGLEGSSYSVYIQGLFAVIARLGAEATALNFRSCALDPDRGMRWVPNRRPRLYHSGETTDLDFALRTLRARHPRRRFVAFGASLGGNVLLKWLGEHAREPLIEAAATLSVPYDLGAGARHLEKGMGRLYAASFLRSLKEKVASVVARFPETATVLDLRRIARARTFVEFDDAATAPLHGFHGARDYYDRSSSIGFIGQIAIPTLCLSSHDDPFLPASVLPAVRAAASSSVHLQLTDSGGHVGFVSGRLPWRTTYWAEELIVRWLSRRIEIAH